MPVQILAARREPLLETDEQVRAKQPAINAI